MSSTPEPPVPPYQPTPPEELLARVKLRSASVRRRRLLGGSGSLTALAAILVVSVLVTGRGDHPGGSAKQTGKLAVSARIGSAYELTANAKALGPASPGVTRDVENAEVAFSLSLLKNLAGPDCAGRADNVLASPSSLAIALTMLELGAAGGTQQQIAATLESAGLSASQQAAGWHSLAALLGRETSSGTSNLRHEPELDIANALFLQQHFPVLASFVDTLSADFGAGLWQVDFHGHLAAATAAMNQWTSEHTHGLINQLLSPGAVSPRTVLVLADAVYFHADWAEYFEKTTISKSFYPVGGLPEQVPFMVSAPVDSAHGLTVPTSSTADYVAVELPYAGRKLSALALMPTSTSLDQFVGSLSTGELDQIVSAMSPTAVDLSLPTFTLRSDYELNQPLSTMGMPDAFGPGADLTAIAPSPPLQVGAVEQHVYLQVTPKGTTAAAATGISVLPTATRQGPVPIVLDHPFLFMIRDNATGTILFESMVENPAG